jgi:hypothetical protein
LREQLQVGLDLDQAAAQQAEIVVVGGNALEGPQQVAIDFLLQIIGPVGLGLDALDVPAMEVFVTAQPEKVTVVVVYVLVLARCSSPP